MASTFNPIEYKINTKKNWNIVAPQYDKNWADNTSGPFRSTDEIVKAAEIKPDDLVLDVACGTGAVSKKIASSLGNSGKLVGIDISRVALSIAKRSIQYQNADFVEMDAENIGLHTQFDKVVCQYGLMFFPDVTKVLKSIIKIIKKNGIISLAVHGPPEKVPYFSCIMNSILKHIPDIRAAGTPTVHRFGNPKVLENELKNSGFSNIKIKNMYYSYQVDSFDEYWADYIKTTANSIWPKIQDNGIEVINAIRKDSEKNTAEFIENSKINFPWNVLIATASK